MNRPLLLDLFCGAGGAAKGYHDAGFDVIGVDIEPQPRYPYHFVQGDALANLRGVLPDVRVAAIHASPPCQAYSSMRFAPGAKEHPQLIEATRERLESSGLPYVIENVEGAPLRDAVLLCGTEFGLRAGGRYLRRHRGFESNVLLMGAGGCHCAGRQIGGVYGTGGTGQMTRGYKFPLAEARAAMGIDWMTRAELSQAIPPAYTQFIGEQLLAAPDEVTP